jgi:hypothetical protein
MRSRLLCDHMWMLFPLSFLTNSRAPLRLVFDYLYSLSTNLGVIEQVRSGNSLRVVLVPSFYEISLILSGVDCPSARPKDPEPFGREARFFTEHHLLNREVTIILEGKI